MEAEPFRNALDKSDRKKILMKCLVPLWSIERKGGAVGFEQLNSLSIPAL